MNAARCWHECECEDACWHVSECAVPEHLPPVSREQAVEAAEDRAEQVAFDAARERP